MTELHSLRDRANAYASSREPTVTLGDQLGIGNDGTVWSSDRNTAIKVFERPNNYSRELGCYERLANRRIHSINGFKIPRLVNHSAGLHVVETTIVQPPYLLDFGKAYLDTSPDFTPEVLGDWEAEKSALYEPGEWPIVMQLLAQLQALGIYYFDAKPANISFG